MITLIAKNRTLSEEPIIRRIIRVEATSMLLYSPRKNRANAVDEYSTLYPATSSASASGRSKGARFVSANIEITKIINSTIFIQINCNPYFCINTKSFIRNDFVWNTIGRIISPIATSYEIIWLAERSPPRYAYFVPDDQPDKIIEYTFSDDIDRTNKIANSRTIKLRIEEYSDVYTIIFT